MINSDPITIGGDYNAVVNEKDIPFLNMEKQRRWDVIISIFYILNRKKSITVYVSVTWCSIYLSKNFLTGELESANEKKILIIEDHALNAGFGLSVI